MSSILISNVLNAGGSVTKIETTFQSDFPQARSITANLHAAEINRFSDWIPKQTELLAYELVNVAIDGAFTGIYNEEGLVEKTNYLQERENLNEIFFSMTRLEMSDEKRLVLVPCNELFNNYFHWISQILPALDCLLKYACGCESVIALPPLNNWQRSSLLALGIGDIDIITLDKSKFYAFARVARTNISTGDATFSRSATQRTALMKIKNSISAATKNIRSSLKKDACIYISRQDAGHRKMSNEAHLISKLEQIGFDIIEGEGLDFESQVRLFNSAGIVVGSHGAGLTNIAFCEPGTFVYELVNGSYPNNCFNSLAHVCGLAYWADLFDGEIESHLPTYMRDWESDTSLVLRRIQELQELRNSARFSTVLKDILCFESHFLSRLSSEPIRYPKTICSLETNRGTKVYWSKATQGLMHIDQARAPRNLYLVDVQNRLFLALKSLSGLYFSISLPYIPLEADTEVGEAMTVDYPQTFEMTFKSDGYFSLSCGGLFLCAQQDGRVTLSRSRIGEWERFKIYQELI